MYSLESISNVPAMLKSQLKDSAYSITSSKDYLMNVVPHCNQFSLLSISNHIYVWKSVLYPGLKDLIDVYWINEWS